MNHEAAVCYQLGKVFSAAANNYEAIGMYSDVLDCHIAGSLFEDGISFIKRCLESAQELPVSKISVFVSTVVKKYHVTSRKAAAMNPLVLEAIHLIPFDVCVNLLKTNKYFEELAELYCEHKQFAEAALIYSNELVLTKLYVLLITQNLYKEAATCYLEANHVSAAAGCYIQLHKQYLQQCYDPIMLSDPVKHSKVFDQAKCELETAYLLSTQSDNSNNTELKTTLMQVQVELASLSKNKTLLTGPYEYFSETKDQDQVVKILEAYFRITEAEKPVLLTEEDFDKIYLFFKIIKNMAVCLQGYLLHSSNFNYNDLNVAQTYLRKYPHK
jgi:hypothetical protein